MALETDRSDAGTPRARRLEEWSERLPTFVVVGLWAGAVSALHFGGLAYDIYTRYWWWDLLTHSTSGFGVAAVFYAVFPDLFHSRLRAYLLVPAAVLLVGAGFEVYEYLFKDFWWHWSPDYYREDTIIDLVLDTAGALAFSVVVRRLAEARSPDGR
jgi:hypothetical protein